MKRFFFFLSCTLTVLLFASCNRTAKFDKTLQEAYKCAVISATTSGYVASNTQSVWNKAIFDHEDSHGKYTSDFNDALKTLYADYNKTGILDSIKTYKTRMDSLAGELAGPPSDRKDAYEDFISMVGEINSLYHLASEPNGNLQNYSRDVMDAVSKINKANDEFSIKYAKFLKKEDDKK